MKSYRAQCSRRRSRWSSWSAVPRLRGQRAATASSMPASSVTTATRPIATVATHHVSSTQVQARARTTAMRAPSTSATAAVPACIRRATREQSVAPQDPTAAMWPRPVTARARSAPTTPSCRAPRSVALRLTCATSPRRVRDRVRAARRTISNRAPWSVGRCPESATRRPSFARGPDPAAPRTCSWRPAWHAATTAIRVPSIGATDRARSANTPRETPGRYVVAQRASATSPKPAMGRARSVRRTSWRQPPRCAAPPAASATSPKPALGTRRSVLLTGICPPIRSAGRPRPVDVTWRRRATA